MRRIIALIVLFIDVYVGIRHAEFGMLGPVVVLAAVLVAILAGAVVVFNLSFTRPGPSQDSGFGMSSPVGIGIGIGFIGIFIFAAAPLFIAARGLYQGRLPAFGSGPDVLFYQRPVAFLLNLSIWVAIGSVILWLLRKTASARKSEDEQGDE